MAKLIIQTSANGWAVSFSKVKGFISGMTHIKTHNMIRAQAFSLYNSTRFITTTDDVKIMDDPAEYYQSIVSTYFATKCFKLARLPGDAQDSFVEDGSITDPSVDPIELDPWFKNLASA